MTEVPPERSTMRSSSKEVTAPDPEDAAETDEPTDLTKRSWKFIVKKTVREFYNDQCTRSGRGV